MKPSVRSRRTLLLTGLAVVLAEVWAIAIWDSGNIGLSIFRLVMSPVSTYVTATVIWFIAWSVQRVLRRLFSKR